MISVGEILLEYDDDKSVPMFGFGGIPRMPNLTSTSVKNFIKYLSYPNNP
jgi:hypothetical protein